jgi:hypothetical protein
MWQERGGGAIATQPDIRDALGLPAATVAQGLVRELAEVLVLREAVAAWGR